MWGHGRPNVFRRAPAPPIGCVRSMRASTFRGCWRPRQSLLSRFVVGPRIFCEAPCSLAQASDHCSRTTASQPLIIAVSPAPAPQRGGDNCAVGGPPHVAGLQKRHKQSPADRGAGGARGRRSRGHASDSRGARRRPRRRSHLRVSSRLRAQSHNELGRRRGCHRRDALLTNLVFDIPNSLLPPLATTPSAEQLRRFET